MRNYFASLVTIAVFMGISASTAFSQNKEGINRAEFYGGFSHNRGASPYDSEDLRDIDFVVGGSNFSNNLGGKFGMNGVNFSVAGNFSKMVGLKFDFSRHTDKRSFTAGGSNLTQDYSISNFLGGIQVKNNKKDGPRAKPFFHALAGIAKQKVNIRGLTGTLATYFGGNQISESQSNFALAVGGGLDIRAGSRVDIRVFQMDYNPTYIKETDDFSSKFQSNFRFGFGIVIH